MTYDFPRAVADVADNSVAAGARNIWIVVSDGSEEDGIEQPYVAVVDDGHGMDAQEIRTALIYGSPSADEASNLGRFGLGLKTASTSQCHVLTVASRKDPSAEFDVRRWDLNFLRSPEANGRWIPLIPPIDEIPADALQLVRETGTVVIWSDLSKLIPKIETMSDSNLASFLGARVTECREHLALVFHRFISGSCRHSEGRQVTVHVNGLALEAWDPFLEGHRAHRSHALGSADLNLEHMSDGEDGGGVSLALHGKTMRIEAHVVPRRDEFHAETGPDGEPRDADAAWKRAGLRNWNDRQGVYFYRLDRVIQAGGWCALMARDEHTKLARLSIDVDRSWDDALFLNVTKTRVIVPELLRKDFRKVFSSARSYAKRVYDGKEGSIQPDDGDGGDVAPPPIPPLPPIAPGPVPPAPPPPPTVPGPEEPGPAVDELLQPAEAALVLEMKSQCRTPAEHGVVDHIVDRVRDARRSS